MLTNSICFIHSFEKRIKSFEYLKNPIDSSWFIFLQETHSTIHDEKKWYNEFKGKFLFSHSQSNFC